MRNNWFTNTDKAAAMKDPKYAARVAAHRQMIKDLAAASLLSPAEKAKAAQAAVDLYDAAVKESKK